MEGLTAMRSKESTLHLWRVTFIHKALRVKFKADVPGLFPELVIRRGRSALSKHLKQMRVGSMTDYELISVVRIE